MPAASQTEKDLQKLNVNYANASAQSANNIKNYADSVFNNGKGLVNVDWQNLYNNANTNSNAINSKFTDLYNGVIPESYVTNKQNTLTRVANNSFGSLLNTAATNGVINSSRLDKGNQSISDSIANTMNDSYLSDIGTLSGILKNQADLVSQPLDLAKSAQGSSLANLVSLYGLSGEEQSPAYDMWKTMSNQRYSAAGKTTTTTSDSGGFLSGLLSGIGSYYGSKP